MTAARWPRYATRTLDPRTGEIVCQCPRCGRVSRYQPWEIAGAQIAALCGPCETAVTP